ncbi:uncharacterized protein VTP21DRAFT_3002 [Calcarisporiella thermophila]|uniref:uncharacterized protein n=1 Tax=Calcarisporiella thermophila TaxID=911321 RepID=UPI003742BDA9
MTSVCDAPASDHGTLVSAQGMSTDPPLAEIGSTLSASESLLKERLEHYFRDDQIEGFLKQSSPDPREGWVYVDKLASLKKIKELSESRDLILKHLRASLLLEVDASETRVRRIENTLSKHLAERIQKLKPAKPLKTKSSKPQKQNDRRNRVLELFDLDPSLDVHVIKTSFEKKNVQISFVDYRRDETSGYVHLRLPIAREVVKCYGSSGIPIGPDTVRIRALGPEEEDIYWKVYHESHPSPAIGKRKNTGDAGSKQHRQPKKVNHGPETTEKEGGHPVTGKKRRKEKKNTQRARKKEGRLAQQVADEAQAAALASGLEGLQLEQPEVADGEIKVDLDATDEVLRMNLEREPEDVEQNTVG